jgi:hypothetical protein
MLPELLGKWYKPVADSSGNVQDPEAQLTGTSTLHGCMKVLHHA